MLWARLVRGWCGNVRHPEKRKVDSSILSLTTSFGLVSGALTSVNADSALQCLQPSSDHDCPCVTVVGRSLSHVDRTPCLRALGSLSTRRRLSGNKPTRTLQGMARVRSGQASAWPLSSGRSVRRGSRIKRDFALRCTFTRPFSTCARCPAVTVTLEARGADTYTQRAIPGAEPSVVIAVTAAEIRRLLTAFTHPQHPGEHYQHWSRWRRHHQAQDRQSHYQRRLTNQPLPMRC